MKERHFENTEEYKKAAEKFETLGSLGVTAEDHGIIGSTPPPELIQNPHKTKAELMTDEEILAWLRTQVGALDELSALERKKRSPYPTIRLSEAENRLARTIRYLRTINRLPKEFSDSN